MRNEIENASNFPKAIRLNRFFTRASVGKPESENANRFCRHKGVIVPGVQCVDRGNWGRQRDIASW